MTEIEKRIDIENWKTTKEVANALGVSTKTILGFRSAHPELFEGLVIVSSKETIKGHRNTLLWGPEAIKILGFNISNPYVDQWKEDVINEVAEKGMIITNSVTTLSNPQNSLELIKLQAKQIQAQSQQIILVIDEMQNMKSEIKELQEKSKNVYILPRTRRILRDEVHRISVEYFNGNHYKVWNPLKAHFQVNKYDEFTEDDAQKILKGIARKYPPSFIQKISEKIKEV